VEPDNGSNGGPERNGPAWSTYTPPTPNIYARIDPQVMLRLVQKAKRLVEDPTSWDVIIRKPRPPFDNGAWFSGYASNEFSESGYLQATLDGTIVNSYVSE
jgi:hypothetical protein